MDFFISDHAARSMRERGIPVWVVEQTVDEPEQVLPGKGKERIYQRRYLVGGAVFLIRVPVADDHRPADVLTAYRTSRISKYWDESGQYDRRIETDDKD